MLESADAHDVTTAYLSLTSARARRDRTRRGRVARRSRTAFSVFTLRGIPCALKSYLYIGTSRARVVSTPLVLTYIKPSDVGSCPTPGPPFPPPVRYHASLSIPCSIARYNQVQRSWVSPTCDVKLTLLLFRLSRRTCWSLIRTASCLTDTLCNSSSSANKPCKCQDDFTY